MHIFTLYNKKVGFYNPPTFSQMDADNVKVNLLRFCKLSKEEALKAHYDECELYYLGTFNDITGEFQLLMKPEYLVNLGEAFTDGEQVQDH